jgi:hypothetical protein
LTIFVSICYNPPALWKTRKGKMGKKGKEQKKLMACSKQKPIRVDRYEMPSNYTIEKCIDEAIIIANRTKRGVSFGSIIIYPLCSKRIPEDKNNRDYYLQLFEKNASKKTK